MNNSIDNDIINNTMLSFGGNSVLQFKKNSQQQHHSSDDDEIIGMDNRTLYARTNSINNFDDCHEENNNSKQKKRKKNNIKTPFSYLHSKEVIKIQNKILGDSDSDSDLYQEDELETSCSDISDGEGEDEDEDDDDNNYMNNTRKKKLDFLIKKTPSEILNMNHVNSTIMQRIDDNGGDDDDRFNIEEFNGNSNYHHRKRRRRKRKKTVGRFSSLKCFGCKYGSPDQDPISGRNMNTLIRIFEENYGRTDNLVLARMCHVYFKQHIWQPMKDMGMHIDMWRTKEILDHFLSHNQEPRIYLGETIKKYKHIAGALESMAFKKIQIAADGNDNSNRETTSIIVPDKANLKDLLDVDKRIIELYKVNPKVLNFYNNNSYIDLAQMGNLMNIHKNFTFD